MHEVHRQEYLASMGIDSYIPRWKIPFAAESHVCEQSDELWSEAEQGAGVATFDVSAFDVPKAHLQTAIDLSLVLKSVSEKPLVKTFSSSVDESPLQLENIESPLIQPFSLSVWRPAPDFLIVAARNVNAMPTELLLNNFLRFYLKQPQLILSEEVLRWPAIENTKIPLTENNAIAELQTWLSVQHEFQQIDQLWLFGDVYRYFVSELLRSGDQSSIEFCEVKLDQTNLLKPIAAKIFPDISQFLKQPDLKVKLLSLV